MEELKLISPDYKYHRQYIDFIHNCAGDIKRCGMDIFIPLSDESSLQSDINNLMNTSRGIGLPDGWVPASTYWLLSDKDDRMLGAINIRHGLTDYLRFRGGHIAYYIHPNERRKGYASKMLKLGLEKCKNLSIDRVLITCAKDNTVLPGLL